jgi:hypothetical protein
VENREVKFVVALDDDDDDETDPDSSYTINENMCAPGVFENIDYSRMAKQTFEVYRNSKDNINEIADVRNVSRASTSCPCPGNLDVDGKLPYTVDELFMALDEDPDLEFVCSNGGLAGNGITAASYPPRPYGAKV